MIDPMADLHRENKLRCIVEKMYQIQSNNPWVPHLPFQSSPPSLSKNQISKRSLDSDDSSPNQPLDFSLPAKKHRLSTDHKHDSFGSDCSSDMSEIHSPDSHGSPKLPRPGSLSPPKPKLPPIKIPIPSPTDSTYDQKPDLLAISGKSIPPSMPKIATTPMELMQVLRNIKAPQSPPSTSHHCNSLINFSRMTSTQKADVNDSQHNIHPKLNISTSNKTSVAKYSSDSQYKYENFREIMLKNIEQNQTMFPQKDSRNQENTGNQKNDFKIKQTSSNKDDSYWERRRKNNEAAKRSRDTRRQKENEIAVRASYLEQENIQLKMELIQLRTELGSIRDHMKHRLLTAS